MVKDRFGEEVQALVGEQVPAELEWVLEEDVAEGSEEV
jgi:hypothetical protein